MTKISIIVPVYNAEPFLNECIDSLVRQTLEDVEIICINDGSTDQSQEILNYFSSIDRRIKVINQSNKGIGYSRNLGLTLASGEYVSFVDADDYVELDAYELAYKKAKETNCDLVIFNQNCIADNLEEVHPDVKKYFDLSRYFEGQDYPEKFNYKDVKSKLLSVTWNIWNKLYKRDFLINNDIKFINTYFQDSPFHLESMIMADCVTFLNQNLYNYRMHNPDSITNTYFKNRKVFDFFIVIDSIKKMLKKRNKFEELKREYIEFKLIIFHSHLSSITDEKLKNDFYEKMVHSIKNEGYSLEELRQAKYALAPDHFLYTDLFASKYKLSFLQIFTNKIAKLYFTIFKAN